MKQRLTAVILLSIVLAACGGQQQPPAAMCDDPTDQPITDAALAAVIRETLGITTGPTCADLDALTEFDAYDSGVA
ncbi:MAG: hypothetical protein KF813_14705, partial [Trueperaceae bacterium]|nr:hypothetical protein [Trueperaceae bacterium]